MASFKKQNNKVSLEPKKLCPDSERAASISVSQAGFQ